MTLYLLDENVLRELKRGGHKNVHQWIKTVDDTDLRLSVATLFEKRRGAEALMKRESNTDLASAIAASLGWDGLIASMAAAASVARPDCSDEFDELIERHKSLRKLGRLIFNAFSFRSFRPDDSVLRAVEHLRALYSGPDELGFVPLSKTGAELLFELISQRDGRGATLITSNLPFDEWTETLGSERLTGALLDRITHHVNILEMNGDSYRLAQSRARKAG